MTPDNFNAWVDHNTRLINADRRARLVRIAAWALVGIVWMLAAVALALVVA